MYCTFSLNQLTFNMPILPLFLTSLGLIIIVSYKVDIGNQSVCTCKFPSMLINSVRML